MYAILGDMDAQNDLRHKRPDEYHCRWLQRDSNACNALPAGIDGIEEGSVCPHNVYHHKVDVFAARSAAADTLERVFRLIGSADCGILSPDLDTLSVAELLAAKQELNKQDSDRMRKSQAKSQVSPTDSGTDNGLGDN